jgi:ankyrin repeat protein
MFPNPQDALPLSPRPNLEQYKKLAKDLVKACKSRDPSALHSWAKRWVESLASLTNLEITPGLPVRLDSWSDGVAEFAQRRLKPSQANSSDCKLASAQFVIARSHGFESWPRFAKHVELSARANSPVSNFEAAADAVVAGDVATLERLLLEDAGLVRARSTREHRTTLLHYVSANGVEGYRQKTPKNAVRIAEILLDAGAEVDATADVYGGEATTLGLVATSIHPERAGVQDELMALLLRHGASMHPASKDSTNPDSTAGAAVSIVNACLANGRGRAAEFFAQHGAPLDLESACGVGALDAVKNFFHANGRLKASAMRAQMERGLMWACEYGRNAVIDLLLRKNPQPGINVHHDLHHDDPDKDNLPHIDLGTQAGTNQTALHWAVIGGQCEAIKLLIDRGAPLEARNAYGATPLGQALWSAVNGDGAIDYVLTIETLLAAGAKIEDGSLAWLANQDAGSASVKRRIAEILRRHGAES